jgi:transposase
MKAYSLDVRKLIVKFVKNGGTKAAATRHFGVSRWTVSRYCEADRAGNLAPKPQGGSKKRFADEALLQDVEAKPSATLEERAKAFRVHHSAIGKRLRLLGITLKKNS